LNPITLDQEIQIWVAVGTWVAGIGTLAAVIVALYLARRVEKVRLKVYVGPRVVVLGDGTPFKKQIAFSVTNLGERPVTIESVGWVIGRGKGRRFAIQPVSGPFTSQYPIEIAHGKGTTFMVSLDEAPNWYREFATGFVQDLSGDSLRTLVAQIHTSVGQTIEVHPEKEILDALKTAAVETRPA
jgi:hypothetical protein